MKQAALLTFILLSGGFLAAQSASICRDVVATAGGHTVFAGKKYEFTFGETFSQTIGNGIYRLSQGFHQPEFCPLTVDILDLPQTAGLLVFPNPTTGLLQLKFANPLQSPVSLSIFNAFGQELLQLPEADHNGENVLDCSSLPAGTYFLVGQTDAGARLFCRPFVRA